MTLCKPPMVSPSLTSINSKKPTTIATAAFSAGIRSMAADRAALSPPPKRPISASEARISLVFALASQASSVSQRLLMDLTTETAKYVFPKRFESRTLEEALISVPDLETVKFEVLSRRDEYEIRQVEPYYIAETVMPSRTGFDFNGSSQSFNVLAEYLFRKMDDQEKWQMSFAMPSKYGADLPLPKDSSVRIKEVPKKTVAVVAFSGFVTDEDVKQRELKLRKALESDGEFQVKPGASVEVAQYNPPFTLSFSRCNEIALEVVRK